MNLHWHRRDLRLDDNLGVAMSTASTPTLPVFVFDPEVLTHAAPPRVSFLVDSLSTLRSAYRERESDLLLVRGKPETAIPTLVDILDPETVTWCRDYSGLARKRDTAVRRELAERNVERQSVDDAVHHPPGEITTNDGNPYRVFTYFSKKWHDRPKADPAESPPVDKLVSLDTSEATGEITEEIENVDGITRFEDVPTVDELGFDEPEADVPPGGTDVARERLHSFCEDDIYRYADRRDYPADDCTSRLSPHLKYGTIGIREVYAATDRASADATNESERDSVYEFQDQLAWREFYTQVLWDRPDVVTANFKTYENPIEWRTDEEGLQAWKDGETGYPIVDAGMRQLRAEAYMHNRVRMIVASFLTKDLLVDWREGYEWFCEKLVDHDTANDNGGWQWAASTGTDAQPYFRIFNPTTQGERYDPDATYIRRYVTELDGVPADVIHSWPDLEPGVRTMHAPEYPEPVVDHSDRRKEAIAMFERARGGN